ncbi:MAG TPA: pseudaminic acid cytidylyltransferase [Cyanobacteria bacterium UBA9579]|nr:pseudaminic acid cytidylyltransferase [Cyanobacteria bacterium UBA9579]
MNIAIIPARGGSKRIPRKNIKLFCGKPMIAWSIEAALKTKIFDHIIISTDDIEIAQVAKEYGAEVPFIRPKELSDDYTGTTEVIAHAAKWAKDQGWNVNAVCCIYATAPFVMATDIVTGLTALNDGIWDYVFSVTDFAAPIFRSFKKTKEGGVEMFFPEHFTTRSQDLPEAFHDAGQFYWGKPESWVEWKKIFDRHSKTIFIPRWRVQDIDTQEDWDRAQILAPIILNSNQGF